MRTSADIIDRLYRDHHALVLSVALGILRRRDDAEDAASAMWGRLSRRPLEYLVAIDYPEPFLRRCIGRAAMDVARKRAVRARLTPCRIDEALGHAAPLDLEASAAAACELRDAMAAVDEDDAAAVWLCDAEGMTAREAAETLGLGPRQMEQRLARARSRVRARLSG